MIEHAIIFNKEQAIERKLICDDCEKLVNKTICGECGCIVIAKVQLTSSTCPLEKW